MAGEGFGGGAAELRIGPHKIWVYSGETVVLTQDGMMIMPSAQWKPGRSRYAREFYRDDRPPKTHDAIRSW